MQIVGRRSAPRSERGFQPHAGVQGFGGCGEGEGAWAVATGNRNTAGFHRALDTL